MRQPSRLIAVGFFSKNASNAGISAGATASMILCRSFHRRGSPAFILWIFASISASESFPSASPGLAARRVFLTVGSDARPPAVPPADWPVKLVGDRADRAECCRPIQYPAPKAVAPTSTKPTKLFVLMTIRQIPSGLEAHVSSFALQGPGFEVFRILGGDSMSEASRGLLRTLARARTRPGLKDAFGKFGRV